MHTAIVDHAADFDSWRRQARWLLNHSIAPESVVWQVAGDADDLFSTGANAAGLHDTSTACEVSTAREVSTVVSVTEGSTASEISGSTHTAFRVPRSFITLAELAVCHRDPHRFALLYRVLWRMAHENVNLLARVTDDDVHALGLLAKAVSRDRHKMTAFVRFRKTPGCELEHYSAWFEPSHHILRLTSDFFCKRFLTMDWSIYTPEGSAHWNQAELVFGPPGTRSDIPDGEVMEDVWRTYFSNIFNPARLRLDAMQSEMPVKYWKNLPEAPLIAKLVHDAGRRTRSMVDAAPTTAPSYAAAALHRAASRPTSIDVSDAACFGAPSTASNNATASTTNTAIASNTATATERSQPILSLSQLRKASKECDRCAHACDATQTVFGQGPASASIMFVGEQPGDIEDVRGRPFVGPSGKLLRSILTELSVDQNEVYFTNAVKHFKFSVRGKRRLHQKPSVEDIRHCRSWLFDELSVVQPSLIIALGGTAARALLGRPVAMENERGSIQALSPDCRLAIVHHPANVLRASSQSECRRLREQLRLDLQAALEQPGTVAQVALSL